MISYRPEFNLYWPDYDPRPADTHHALMKRAHHADAVLPFVRGRECVVQAGGHVGVWPCRLGQHFARVYTFEPDEACFSALNANLLHAPGGDRVVMARCAALRHERGAGYMIRGKCSSWRFTWEPEEADGPAVAATTIDSLALTACDAIILDVEGSELEALKGAADTIARFRPVIQLEEWYDSRGPYLAYMRGIGYRPVAAAGADTIYAPAELD